MTDQPPPEPQGTPVDPGNPILGRQSAQLSASRADIPVPVLDETTGEVRVDDQGRIEHRAQPHVVLTIRTPSTTLTVFLPDDHAASWADTIARTAGVSSMPPKMAERQGGLILPNGVPHLEPGIAEALRRDPGHP